MTKTSRVPSLVPFFLVQAVCLLAFVPTALGQQSSALPKVTIGIVLDGETLRSDLYDPTVTEIQALLDGEFDVRFEKLKANWTSESVNAAVDNVLNDDNVDIVIAMGALSSQMFCCRDNLPKPVIAAVVVDTELQGLPMKDGRSGVKNLNYVVFPDSFASDLRQFRAIVPIKKLAVGVGQWFTRNIEGVDQRIALASAPMGLQTVLVEIGDSVDEAVKAIPDSVDGLYLAPVLHFSEAERRELFDKLAERRLPTFSIFGVLDVERGALAGQRDRTFYERLSRRVALNVQRILLGEDAGDIPVAIPDRQLLTINMETARRTGIYPPWNVIAEAELLNEDPQYERTLSLQAVVREAIEVNLDVLAREREVAAGAQDVARARSVFRPQADLGANVVQIDDDRVSALSQQGETTLTGELSFSQLLYSEPANANLDIQESLQKQRELGLEQLRLDIARDAALAYLDVLRARTFEGIRKSDLRLTRSNLEAAQIRQDLGTAGPGEVYRWQAQRANARRDLVEAQSTRFQAHEALNRILRRWQPEGFEVIDVTLDDPQLITSKERIYAYTASPIHSEVFGQFSVEFGLERAPELAQIDAAIAAQERVLKSTQRAYNRPDVALQASLQQIIEAWSQAEGGFGFPSSDETSWNVAVGGSYRLFTGGERRADEIQAEETLQQLRLERNSVADKLEQRIRSLMHRATASFSGVELTREASEAAQKGYELVRDAYSRGTVDILDLLDAQNTALASELAAADALYQFLIDLIEFQRAINRLDFFTMPEEDEYWFEEIDRFFAQSGVKPFFNVDPFARP